MNLILLENPCSTCVLTDRRFEHLKNVLRASCGSECKVGVRNGKVGRAVVVGMTDCSAELSVMLEKDPPAKLPLVLALALPRPQTLKKVLHSAITMGARHIAFFHSFKVEKSYWQSPCLAPDFLDREQVLALEQCGDTVPAEISFHRNFKAFVTEELPDLAGNARRLVAHPSALQPAPGGLRGEQVCLVLGPEGGFTDGEYEAFLNNGFSGISLGNRILRTEVALPALLGRLFA